ALTLMRGAEVDRSTSTRTTITMLEAATGTGKTLAYLIPLLLAVARTGQRAAISSYTIALQSQLESELKRIEPVIRSLGGHMPNVALRFGIRNFVCLSRVQELLRTKLDDGVSDHDEGIHTLRELCDWADRAQRGATSGVLRDFLSERDRSSLPFDIREHDVA